MKTIDTREKGAGKHIQKWILPKQTVIMVQTLGTAF
jgi:hypothetical protein